MPRHSIPNSQKAALREQRRLHPTATQKQLGHWFFETFGHRPTQSTISAILSSNYRHLDAGMTAHISNAKRRRSAKWPDLEAALIHWITLSRGTIPISQEVIREKARFFWNQLPEYEGMEMPIFSNGWLAGFQARGSVRSRSNLGEDGSTPAAAAEAMIPIRQALEAYDPKDIFNCDETALYWKRIPDRSLTTEALPGQMQRKAKISALFCCNADGSEKLHPWFIGTAQKPRAVVAAGVNISNLNFRWKSNTKSCMVTKFFEWLRWFDQKMVNRKVVLLMDNFSVRESAVRAINASWQLQNTSIIWLPANSTSRFQPLDQGIIRTWKAYWKRKWIGFMVDEFDNGQDPIKSMNVLKALQWRFRPGNMMSLLKQSEIVSKKH
ncbi:hypothetical protein N7461_004373 [Penicillium sp. DV-2018c]|nr:hypothetical protein N7461_004373 [Penicillium sp. DV-2018c]